MDQKIRIRLKAYDHKVLDQSATEIVSTAGLPLSKAVKLILGKADTKVKLTVKREGVAAPFDVEITRGMIQIESVLGIRRKADHERAPLNPVHLVVAALGFVVLFIFTLLMIVKFVLG